MRHEPAVVKSSKDRGAVIVIVAVAMIVLLGVAALAVDIGYVAVTKNELQNIADAAALAGAGELSRQHTLDPDNQENFVADRAQILAIVQDIAGKNRAANLAISIASGDVVIGRWNSAAGAIPEENLARANAVRVMARRDESLNSAVNTFFARVIGIDTVPVTADATAALTGQSTAEPGEVELPIGISVKWFEDREGSYCGEIIKFSPSTDPDACAGWNSFDDYPANDNKVRTILDDMAGNPNPVIIDDSAFNFINGDLSSNTFERLMTDFQIHGYDIDSNGDRIDSSDPLADSKRIPLLDADGVQMRYPPCSGASGCIGELRYKHAWDTTVVVYDSDDCTPNGSIPIKGFVQVQVIDVGQPSNKTVAARIDCDYVDTEASRGGGGEFGLLGSIPGLVE